MKHTTPLALLVLLSSMPCACQAGLGRGTNARASDASHGIERLPPIEAVFSIARDVVVEVQMDAEVRDLFRTTATEEEFSADYAEASTRQLESNLRRVLQQLVARTPGLSLTDEPVDPLSIRCRIMNLEFARHMQGGSFSIGPGGGGANRYGYDFVAGLVLELVDGGKYVASAEVQAQHREVFLTEVGVQYEQEFSGEFKSEEGTPLGQVLSLLGRDAAIDAWTSLWADFRSSHP